MQTPEELHAAIERWAEKNFLPDFMRLARYREEYVKIWVEPWFGLEKKNPPEPYRSHILTCLLDIFESWYAALLKEKRPFDLQFWLFEESFIRSEVVAARVSNPEMRRNNYFHPADEIRRFPYEKFFKNRERLRDLEWSLFWEGDYLHPGVDGISAEKEAELIAGGYRREPQQNPVEGRNYLLFKPTERVWVGRWII